MATPGLISNPEVKPRLVPRCTAFREGAGSAETVGTLIIYFTSLKTRTGVKPFPNIVLKHIKVQKPNVQINKEIKAKSR